MPSRGKYITFFVFNWVFGILWGFLSLGAFITMNKAIEAGDVEQAQISANKVKTIFFIGLIVNIVLLILYIVLFSAGICKFSTTYR